MSWSWIAIAAGACFVLKITGLLIPTRTLENPAIAKISQAIPVALLSALIAVQTFTDQHQITVDARLGGLVAAAVALRLRAPFLVVVIAAGATTAALRWLGLSG